MKVFYGEKHHIYWTNLQRVNAQYILLQVCYLKTIHNNFHKHVLQKLSGFSSIMFTYNSNSLIEVKNLMLKKKNYKKKKKTKNKKDRKLVLLTTGYINWVYLCPSNILHDSK